MTNKVLIFIETYESKIEAVSKEIACHAFLNFPDAEINGILFADKETSDNTLEELYKLPLNKIYIVNDNVFDNFNTCIFADELAKFIKKETPDILLIGATENGRDLAPRTASKLNIGLTADCTDLQVDEKFSLLATRPTYGGKMMATIISKTKPNCATVRTGAFKQLSVEHNQPEIIYIKPELSGIKTLVELIKCNPKPQLLNWTCHDIIVAGGLGLKTKENFELIYKFAELINGKPAASRAAVEMGWAEQSIQVGQTGHSVSPKLYIAFGISGAMQHLTGINNADKIIAINSDKTAPIMHCSDKAIVADAVSVLNSLIEKYGN